MKIARKWRTRPMARLARTSLPRRRYMYGIPDHLQGRRNSHCLSKITGMKYMKTARRPKSPDSASVYGFIATSAVSCNELPVRY